MDYCRGKRSKMQKQKQKLPGFLWGRSHSFTYLFYYWEKSQGPLRFKKVEKQSLFICLCLSWRGWTQGLVCAMQVFYLWATTPVQVLSSMGERQKSTCDRVLRNLWETPPAIVSRKLRTGRDKTSCSRLKLVGLLLWNTDFIFGLCVFMSVCMFMLCKFVYSHVYIHAFMCMCVCMLLCMCVNVRGTCEHTQKEVLGIKLISLLQGKHFPDWVTSPESWIVGFRPLHNLWGSDSVGSCYADSSLLSCFGMIGKPGHQRRRTFIKGKTLGHL